MSGESFEWAIKKDVRNNPIVREVDLERHRDMWRSVAFSVLFVAVLLFVAWQQFSLQQYGYRMGDTQKLLEKEQSATRHLRLEIQALMAHQVIEKKATEQLHMVEPGPGDSTVIERVVEPPAPPMSVLAQR
jgi:cell division protein FtsL